jgi:hypothetical protein
MKTTKFTLVALACIAVLGLSNCKNTPTEKAEGVDAAQENLEIAEQNYQEAVVDSTNEYTRYKLESNEKLKANDQKIAELKANMKAKKLKDKTNYEIKLNELEQKNAKLKSSIADYKESDKNKWEIFKVNFKKDMDELGKAISNAAQEK